MSARTGVTLGWIAVGAIAMTSLAGCTPGDSDSEPSSGPSVSASASSTPSESPSPSSGSSTGTGTGTALDVSCLDLVSLDTMYRFDPNFGLDDGYSPAAGTPAAKAVSDSGVACGWLQQTSGEVIEIAAAKPSASALEELKTVAGVDASGRAFSASGGKGTVQVFSGPYWVVATSSYFTRASDAQPLVDSTVGALG